MPGFFCRLPDELLRYIFQLDLGIGSHPEAIQIIFYGGGQGEFWPRFGYRVNSEREMMY